MRQDQFIDISEKWKISTKRNNILSKVKQHIDEFLDPSQASYVDNLTVNKALKFLYTANEIVILIIAYKRLQ